LDHAINTAFTCQLKNTYFFLSCQLFFQSFNFNESLYISIKHLSILSLEKVDCFYTFIPIRFDESLAHATLPVHLIISSEQFPKNRVMYEDGVF
jgi:hypothetical protein